MEYADYLNGDKYFRVHYPDQNFARAKAHLVLAQDMVKRLDEMQDPELASERGYEYYRRKGYGEKWIEQRMQGKATRKELTDEWKRCGVYYNL